MGGDGVLVATADGVRERIAPYPVEVVCGLGAGDAFGGAFCHGLLSGWDIARCARAGNAAGAIVASRLMCADDMPYAGGHRCRPRRLTDVARCAMHRRSMRRLVADAAATCALERLRTRRRRPLLTDGRLFIVAADHTARGMLGVPGEPFAMADRRRTLEALLVALGSPGRRRRAGQRRHHGGPRRCSARSTASWRSAR